MSAKHIRKTRPKHCETTPANHRKNSQNTHKTPVKHHKTLLLTKQTELAANKPLRSRPVLAAPMNAVGLKSNQIK